MKVESDMGVKFIENVLVCIIEDSPLFHMFCSLTVTEDLT